VGDRYMMYLKNKNRLCVGKVYGLDGRRNPKMPAVLALVYLITIKYIIWIAFPKLKGRVDILTY
jgi:hypothetical protein